MSRALPSRRVVAPALTLVALLLAGCISSEEGQRQPEVPDDGLQATGLLGGSRVAISRGEPDVVDGDCDANDGTDRDLCMRVRTIDGVSLNLVLENPDALEVGRRLEVRADTCEHCDEVDTHAVVRLRIGGDTLQAEAGHVTPTAVGDRTAAAFDLRLPGGDRLTGSFSVRPAAARP